MNKYIDADRLREKIAEQMESLPREIGRGAGTLTSKGYGMMEAFQIMRSIIDSLQQDQPEQKKKCNDCPHCVDRKDQYGWHFKGCFGGPYKGKFIAEIDECPLEQEWPEVDLEKEIDKEWKKCCPTDEGMGLESANIVNEQFDAIARHFAEWGARHSINWGDVQLLDTFILELSREEKDGADWGDSKKFYTEVLHRFHEFNDKKIPEIVAEWEAKHLKK